MRCYNCLTCVRPDCVHREAFRKLPREDGGLDLCPGHMSDTTAEIAAKIDTLREWEALAAEAAAEIESIKDELKKHMNDLGVEEAEIGTHILRWTTVKSNRLDTAALKKENNSLYLRYLKQTTSRRFSVS